jgi:hypothetical protein
MTHRGKPTRSQIKRVVGCVLHSRGCRRLTGLEAGRLRDEQQQLQATIKDLKVREQAQRPRMHQLIGTLCSHASISAT